jgi:ribosomal protein S18 acetylase RimI-like enzyme
MRRIIHEPDTGADAAVCHECGLNYARDLPSDRRYHDRVHDETVNGVRAPTPKRGSETVIGCHGEFELLFAATSVSSVEEQRLEKAAANARGDAPYSFGMYHVGDTERAGSRVVWARNSGRIVGLAVIDTRVKAAHLLPLERLSDEWVREALEESNHVLAGIAVIWVLRKHRRRGLGKALLEACLKQLDGTLNEVAFQIPFTAAGARFVYETGNRLGLRGLWIY